MPLLDYAAAYRTAKDPDKALTVLNERMSIKPYLIGDCASGLAMVRGEIAAAQWAAQRLDPLEGHLREWALSNLNPSANAEHITAMMAALTRPEDRMAYGVMNTTSNLGRNDELLLTTIRTMPSEQEQIQVLSRVAAGYALPPRKSDSGEPLIDLLLQAMERAGMTERAKTEIMAAARPGAAEVGH